MDWDGIGTLAFFFGSGAVGVGLIALRAYKAKLSARLEWARLRHIETLPEEVLEQIQDLEAQVHRLTERLVSDGRSEPSDAERAV